MTTFASLEFTIDSNILFKELSAISKIVVRNPVVPMLGNFLFDISNNTLNITGSDLQTSVITTLAIQSSDNGKVAVPSMILLDTLRNLPAQPIQVEVNLNNYNITIKAVNGKYKISCENASDFPQLPTPAKEETLGMSALVLKKAIKKTLFATSKDEIKPNLCGVNIIVEKDDITFAATDGHRLVRYQVTAKLEGDSADSVLAKGVTLPSKPLTLLHELLPDTEEPLKLLVDEKNIYFWVGHIHIITSLVDETYPDYNAIIPKNSRFTLQLNTQNLRDSVKIVNYYTNKTTNQICLVVEKDYLEVKAEDLEFFNEAETKIEIKYEGEPMKVGVNAKLFLEMLQNITYKELIFELETPQRAIVIKPFENGATAHKENLLMLIMPVLLKS